MSRGWLQENCKVRGLVHFSVIAISLAGRRRSENMYLSPSLLDFAVLLGWLRNGWDPSIMWHCLEENSFHPPEHLETLRCSLAPRSYRRY